VAFGNETYVLTLKIYDCRYYNYIRNMVGRSFGRFLRIRLLSGCSMRFTTMSFGCALRLALIERCSGGFLLQLLVFADLFG
jgi:hypothetical protein